MSEESTGNPPEASYRLIINRRCDWVYPWRCTIWPLEFVFEERVDVEGNTRGIKFCIITSNALLFS